MRTEEEKEGGTAKERGRGIRATRGEGEGKVLVGAGHSGHASAVLCEQPTAVQDSSGHIAWFLAVVQDTFKKYFQNYLAVWH